jgi:hypothetical protein
MRVEDKVVNLALGMAVTVEIKTGTRCLIEYVMPLPPRYRQEPFAGEMEKEFFTIAGYDFR